MADLRKLKDKAAELAAKGKLEKAADVFREILQADPRDVATRQKLADTLRRAGAIAGAIGVYREVADRYAADGQLIKAIAICKTILELDPSHADTQAALAELYARRGGARPPARRSKAVLAGEDAEERAVAIPLGPGPGEPPWLGAAETPFEQIAAAADAAVDAGVEEEIVLEPEPLDELEVVAGEPLPAAGAGIPAPAPVEPAPPPAHPRPARAPPSPAAAGLPRVPIFSDLSREAFVALTSGMLLHRVGKGETVLSEGDEGASFYVVATGRLAVSKRDDLGRDVVLAELRDGDFFGEMALLSGARRSATVTAAAAAEVLELPAGVLLALAERHPHVAESLRRFYRRRLLANAMATSAVFRPFPKKDRKLVIERFREREVAPGDVVVREGDPSDGLYVILDGAVDVVKRKDGGELAVCQLREGDVFGEMSCLRKAPASATVKVRRGGTLLRLPRAAFDELVTAYPQILELVAELSDERAESLDAILTGHAQWTDEGLVLI